MSHECERALWSAFDAAMVRARTAFVHLAPGEELESFLSALRGSVDQLVEGDEDRPLELPFIAAAGRIVEYIRRSFIECALETDEMSDRDAMALLGALARLERNLPSSDNDVSALGLSVEIAHDMRSPLTAILFLLDTLRSGRTGTVNQPQARQLGIAYGAAFGLNQMASDLIDHVRGHERMIEAHPMPFSVTELLHSVRDILAPLVEERKLDMQIVPPAEHARLGYPIALHRVLLNLATNAVKFTSNGSVMVSARELGRERVQFAVADTGPGIPPKVQAQLFKPFRVTSVPGRPVFSSSGLGLSICQRLVTSLGSTLKVASQQGKGTTFSFDIDLPLAQRDQAASPAR